MNILMLVFNQRGRGTYWRAFHFARELVVRGHQVDLLTTSVKGRFRFVETDVEGVRVVETPDLLPGALRSGWDAWNTLRRLDYLRGRVYDITHSFETRPVNIYPALAARQRGVRLVFDWADWFGRGGSVEQRPNSIVRALVRPVDTFFENRYRNNPDGTTVINTFLEKRALEAGIPQDRLCVLRNGSDPRQPVLPISEARSELNLPRNVPILSFVGGTYQQDAALMARSINQVHRTNPAVRLLLVGYFNRSIEDWVDHPESIIRTGPVSSDLVYRYLSASDLGWLPLTDSGANRGRWPFKLNDYMTVGRATLATDVGDLEHFILEHKIGEVTAANPTAFAAGTLSLLNDPDPINRLWYSRAPCCGRTIQLEEPGWNPGGVLSTNSLAAQKHAGIMPHD